MRHSVRLLLMIFCVLGPALADEPEEKVIPGYEDVAKAQGVLPPVQRGEIVVWPAVTAAERKKVVPPTWTGEKATPDRKEYLEILVKKDGEIFVGGKQVTLRQLTLRALVHAERDRDDDHPMKPSNMPAVIHASKDTRWRNLQWTMQALADPDVRIWRIWLAMQDENGMPVYVKVFLPIDRGVVRGLPSARMIEVELKRRKEEKQTRVELLDRDIGMDLEGFEILDVRVRQILKENPGRPAQLNAWAWVPFAHAAKAIEILKAAKVSLLTFTGAPPPRDRPRPLKPLVEIVPPPLKQDGLVIWPAAPREVREAVTLPTWSGATKKPENDDFVEVVVDKDGKTWVAGVEVDRAGLKKWLKLHADRTRDRKHPRKVATRAVLIRASKDTPWRSIRAILDTCTDTYVRIFKLCFALKDKDQEPFILEMFLTIDPYGQLPKRRVEIPATLKREKGNEDTRVFFNDQEIGTGASGFEALGAKVKEIVAVGGRASARLSVEASVPHADVMRAVEMFLGAGVADLDFAGADDTKGK